MLTLEAVIEAHRAWRQQLADTLNRSPVEPLEIAAAGRSDRCVPGRWIVGPGQHAYGHRAEYQELIRAHAKFHLIASAVLIAHHAGTRDEAARLLNGDFERLSEQVQLSLTRLFSAAPG